MARVLAPGGTAAVLEFVRPRRGLLGAAYRLYLRRGLPLIGGAISGEPRAYRYLSDTIDSYRTPGELAEMAASAGWLDVRVRLLSMGTVGLLTGRRA
jgi:ubiquinone/menaquinone biosynthesis C-methylase UbiE